MADSFLNTLSKNSNKANSANLKTNANASKNILSTNFAKNSNNSGSKSWLIIGLIGFVLVVVLIIIIVVLVQKAKEKKNNVFTIINSPLDAFGLTKKEFKVPNSELGLEFTYSVWIFIQDWTRGWKNIFVKGDKNNAAGTSAARAPGLWLYPDTNALHARINTFASPNEGCDIKNIPLQKWVHITYILNNRTVDIYIDGKLERSCVLRGVPKLNNSPLYVCDNNGFFGKISNLVYYKYALKPNEVYELYSKGPY